MSTAKVKKVKPFFLRAWLIGQLRRATRRYPPYFQTLSENKVYYTIKSKTGKDLKRVKIPCKVCKEYFKSTEIAVDHVVPVVGEEGFPVINGQDDWATYINRLFCDKSNLQTICHTCHNSKTLLERNNRKATKNKK